jgi:hypothetical protein
LHIQGTPFDFRTKTSIGSRIEQFENGYDHNLVLHRPAGGPDLAFALR